MVAERDADCLVRCLASKEDATNGFFVACFERIGAVGSKGRETDNMDSEKKQKRNAKRRAKKKKNKGKKRHFDSEQVDTDPLNTKRQKK